MTSYILTHMVQCKNSMRIVFCLPHMLWSHGYANARLCHVPDVRTNTTNFGRHYASVTDRLMTIVICPTQQNSHHPEANTNETSCSCDVTSLWFCHAPSRSKVQSMSSVMNKTCRTIMTSVNVPAAHLPSPHSEANRDGKLCRCDDIMFLAGGLHHNAR